MMYCKKVIVRGYDKFYRVCLKFSVDASRAGTGEVDTVIKCDNKKLPVKMVDKGHGHFKAYFMPKEPCKHLAFITFSKESVPGQQ